MDSPRGRIALMRAASDGRIELNSAFAEHIDLCLGCRACETACPSGVQYGALVEVARAEIHAARPPAGAEKAVRRLALHDLLPYTGRLRTVARSLTLYQRSGLQTLVRRTQVLPEPIQEMELLLPSLSLDFPDYTRPAPAMGERRGVVAFFHGCIQDAFFADVNQASIRVLQRNGFEVHFPAGQTCCGAAHSHTGEMEMARDLARRNLDAFDPGQYAAIINNAGGCGAALKEYDHLLADDPDYAEAARRFVAKVQDITEFLADNLHNPPTGRLDLRVTYADSCHLRHVQHVVQQPRDLLHAIPGLTLVELAQPDACCGSAGVYNIVHPDTAGLVLDAKLDDIETTAADVIAITNTGCHMQLLYGARKAELGARVMHVVELLDLAYDDALPSNAR
jgi:glycolate oxidase iron-sulfur subunit